MTIVPCAWTPDRPRTTRPGSAGRGVRRDRAVAQREREQQARDEQADRQRDVRREDRREQRRQVGHRSLIVAQRGRFTLAAALAVRPGGGPRARPSRPRSSGSRSPGRGPEGGRDVGLAVLEDPRREQRAAGAQVCDEPVGERDQHRRDQVAEDEVERALAAGRAALARPDRAAPARCGGVRARRVDRDRVDVHGEHAARAELARRRSTGSRSRSPHRARLVPGPDSRRSAAGPDRPSTRAPRGTAGSSGGGRSRTPCPGRARARRRRAPGGGAARSAGSRSGGRSGAPGSAPSTRSPSRPPARGGPRGRRSAAARTPGGARGPAPPARPRHGPDAGDVDERQVRAHERGPGEVDARSETLVHELERRLDARPAGRRPRQDLGHGLDGLVVGGDRELEPGAGRCAAASEVDARRARSGGPAAASSVGGRPPGSPEAELLAQARVLRDRLAALGRVLLEQLALALAELGRDDDVGDDVEVALDRLAAEVRHARPRRRISVPGWVPGLISTSMSSPSAVGTLMFVPSAAWTIERSAS